MARFGVERDDESARRRDVEFALVLHRSGFEPRIAAEVVNGFARVISPDDFEAGNIGWRNWINLRAREQGDTEEEYCESHGCIVKSPEHI